MSTLWLDAITLETIQHAEKLGLLAGITTNPLILAESPLSARQLIDSLLAITSLPVAVQVNSLDMCGMVEEGRSLAQLSSQILVKIPAIEAGYEAIHTLSREGVPTMATVVLEPLQAFLAASAGAHYIAPYYSHLGERPLESLMQMRSLVRGRAECVVASLKERGQVEEVLLADFAVTLKKDLWEKCLSMSIAVEKQLGRFAAVKKS